MAVFLSFQPLVMEYVTGDLKLWNLSNSFTDFSVEKNC